MYRLPPPILPIAETDEWYGEDFDLSALTYQEFRTFFFDRRVVDHREAYDLFVSGFDNFVASDPTIVVGHLHAICLNFAGLREIYSDQQIDQGLWAILGLTSSCEKHLFDPVVNQRVRIECVESMYLPFKDAAGRRRTDILESVLWMWWDLILHEFLEGAKYDYSLLTDDQKQINDAMYQTLLRILALDDWGCQKCALHGLGHLHHPLVRETVQGYLNVHKSELTANDLRWVEACGVGRIA